MGYGALQPRHRMFALAVLQGLNHRQAAIHAGYKEKDAAARGAELARNPRILAFLNQAYAKAGAEPARLISNVEEMALRLQADIAERKPGNLDFSRVFKEWHQVNTLRAAILGKLDIKFSVSHSGTMKVVHTTEAEQARIIELRRQYEAMREAHASRN